MPYMGLMINCNIRQGIGFDHIMGVAVLDVLYSRNLGHLARIEQRPVLPPTIFRNMR